jgi:hypothetical protein
MLAEIFLVQLQTRLRQQEQRAASPRPRFVPVHKPRS